MKKILNILGLASALALCGTQPASAMSLVFSPHDQTVIGVGSSVSVDVQAINLGGLSVGSYDFFVGWDSGILDLTSVTYGNANFTGDQGVFKDLGPTLPSLNSQEVNGFALGNLMNQNGAAPIDFMTFNFKTVGLGFSALTFADGILGLDANGNVVPVASLGDDQLTTQPIAANKVSGSIDVIAGGGGTVPEPSMILLFGSAFMGLLISGRRSKTAI